MTVRQTGFTLLELLVTLVIMVAVFSVAIPQYAQSMSSLQLRKNTRQIAAVLREARNASVREARTVVLVVDSSEREIRQGEEDPVFSWPEDIDVEISADERIGAGIDNTISFRPDGTATSRTLVVATESRQYAIAVDWLTGQVKVL